VASKTTDLLPTVKPVVPTATLAFGTFSVSTSRSGPLSLTETRVVETPENTS
jgi:hypothetical protein